MKLFYLARPERIKEIPHPCHFLIIDGHTHHLVCVDWRGEAEEMQWAAKDGVIALPHPYFDPTAELSDEHIQHLAKRFQVKKGHNVHHVIKEAAKDDLWMRVHAL